MLRYIVIITLLFNQNIQAKHLKISLQQALDRRLVTASGKSLGFHQGFCTKLSFKNLSKDSLVVEIEAGRKLNSVEDINQDILVVKSEWIRLSNGETKSILVKGYCCQASRHSPKKDSKYTLAKMADSNLVRLAKYLNVKNFDPDTEQNAIWALSDNKATANITALNDSNAIVLREFVSILKDEPLPWYTTVTQSFTHSNGELEHFPKYLRGSLNYDNDKDKYVTFTIIDEKGFVSTIIKQEWLLAGKGKYQINVAIAGMKKGKYSVLLKGNETILAKQLFEI